MLKIVSAVLKLLVRVNEKGALVIPTAVLGNFFELGATLTGWTPIPVRLIICGLLLALSVIVTDPVMVPVVVGLKVTEIVHLAPATTVVPHVLVWANGTLAATLEMASALVPVLVRVTFFVPLVDPITWLPKERLVEERETVCAAAQPVISPKTRIPSIDLPQCRCIAAQSQNDEP